MTVLNSTLGACVEQNDMRSRCANRNEVRIRSHRCRLAVGATEGLVDAFHLRSGLG